MTVYNRLSHQTDRGQRSNAIVVGKLSSFIALENALKSERPCKFRVVGFLDVSGKIKCRKINGLPVFNFSDDFDSILKSRRLKSVIVSDEDIDLENKEKLIDIALKNEVQVFKASGLTNRNGIPEIRSNIKRYRIEDLLERNPLISNNVALSHGLKGKTILVTGAAGSIGSEIVRQILKFQPSKVVLLDQAETPMHSLLLGLLELNTGPEIISVLADIRDKAVLTTVFADYQPDIVYHAAAYKHVPMMESNPAQAIFTNVLGTKNLADLAVEFGVSKFVMVSTDKAVNPGNVMGASKRIAEKYVQSLQRHLFRADQLTTRFITTRFGNVLGSNGSVLPLFSKQIENGGPVTITHPDIIRYFMTIHEACQLVLEAGKMGFGGEIFIFDMGKPVKIVDLAIKMIKLAGLIPEKNIEIQFTGLRPGEKLFEELTNVNSKTLPTYHEKITIFQDQIEDYDSIHTKINELIDLSSSLNGFEIVKKMKEILPEFKSKNSDFQRIDEAELKKAS